MAERDASDELRRRFAKRLKRARVDAGLSQLDMVRLWGFSLSHYQALERGDVEPRLSTLKRLAESFGVTLSELVEGL